MDNQKLIMNKEADTGNGNLFSKLEGNATILLSTEGEQVPEPVPKETLSTSVDTKEEKPAAKEDKKADVALSFPGKVSEQR
jgi:hypothetical protein